MVREYNNRVYIINLVTRLINIQGKDYRYYNIIDISDITDITNIINTIKEIGRYIGVIEVSYNNVFIKLAIGTMRKL